MHIGNSRSRVSFKADNVLQSTIQPYLQHVNQHTGKAHAPCVDQAILRFVYRSSLAHGSFVTERNKVIARLKHGNLAFTCFLPVGNFRVVARTFRYSYVIPKRKCHLHETSSLTV